MASNRTRTEEEADAPGVKKDAGKARWDLLPWREVRDIVDVLTQPIVSGKYTAYNWQKVDDAKARYFAATLRHLAAWREGQLLDPESGLPHLAHAACNLLFLAWFDRWRS